MHQTNTPDEDYIISESAEISVGENISWTDKIASSFPAFKSQNYKLFFFGQLISLVGTWLQIVAEGWLVFQLTHSAFYVGLDAAAATVPSLFLSLFGGVIVDRYPKKKILIFTQTASMILAFILGILAVLGIVQVWQIILLSFLLGLVNAIDIPARQAILPELVEDKGLLTSAVALNSGIFNAARVVGPTIAGILIAFFGSGIAFILNGVSYIAVIIALYFIKTPDVVTNNHIHPITAIKEGLRYVYHHELIRSLIILSSVTAIFGWSYSTLMPVIAQNIFHLDAKGLGYLYAVTGVGALLSTFIISAYSNKIKSSIFILGGIFIFSIFLIIFSLTTNVYLAALCLFFIGLGLVLQFSMINNLIQHAVDNSMRGRVMSIYALSFMGLFPLGNFEIGYIAEKFGVEFAIRLSAFIVLIFGLIIVFYRRNKNKL